MLRRSFLKKTTLGALALSTLPVIASAKRNHTQTVSHHTNPQPSPDQQAWMNLKLGIFIHFGINTYYDMEWSDGTLDPAKVNPYHLDTDQWCRTAKEAGMKYLVITTKHHDGFCNWNTRLTDYSIMNTPFKKDLISILKESCDKFGLKLGFYYSLWDMHEKTHNTDEHRYSEFVTGQLDELLSNYGEIVSIWFDGFWKKQQHGWETEKEEIDGELTGSIDGDGRDERFINAWRCEGAYRWEIDRLYRFIKTKQPDCIVMNNPTSAYKTVPLFPVDARCAEKGHRLQSDRKVWKWLGKDMYFPLQIETTLSVKGNQQFPSGNWFWHEWDHSVAAKEDVLQWIAAAKRLDANLLLNCGVSDEGKLRPEDEKLLLSLNE